MQPCGNLKTNITTLRINKPLRFLAHAGSEVVYNYAVHKVIIESFFLMTSTVPVNAKLPARFHRLSPKSLGVLQHSSPAHIRLLELVLLPLLILDLVAIGVMLAANKTNHPIFAIACLCVVSSGCIYALNRRGHYALSAVVLLGTIYVGIFAAILSVNTLYVLLSGSSFLILVVLLASLLLDIRAIRVTAAASLGGVAALAILYPDDALLLLGGPGILLLTTSAIILGAAYPRRKTRQQMEAQALALAESEERYRSLLRMGFETLLIHENGIVVDASDAVEKMFGYRLHEVIGRALLDFIAPQSHRELINRTRHSRSDGAFEAIARRKDGATLRVEIMERMAVYRGRPMQVIVIRDLTERMRMEAHRLELAVERERVTVLQQFISDASHDFRAPLTNLKASLYLVKKLTDQPEKQAKHISVMEHYTVHLEKLLDDLLTMSRLEYAAEELLLDPIDINSLLRELAAKFRTRYPERSNDLQLMLEASLPPIWAEKSTLAQAFSRVLENAYHYTQSPQAIILRSSIQGACVRIDIEDHGIGIEPENLAHIFKSFYRADKARGSYQGGTGLGLPIALKIIEAHDGSITVQSAPNSGTTVTILLPYVTPTGGQSPQFQPAHPEGVSQPAL